jgi:hypothetical protein
VLAPFPRDLARGTPAAALPASIFSTRQHSSARAMLNFLIRPVLVMTYQSLTSAGIAST